MKLWGNFTCIKYLRNNKCLLFPSPYNSIRIVTNMSLKNLQLKNSQQIQRIKNEFEAWHRILQFLPNKILLVWNICGLLLNLKNQLNFTSFGALLTMHLEKYLMFHMGVIRTLANIYDGAPLQKQFTTKVVDYFRKNFSSDV